MVIFSHIYLPNRAFARYKLAWPGSIYFCTHSLLYPSIERNESWSPSF